MDWNRIEGNWKLTKGKIKEKWGQLTDDDMTLVNGKREQLEGKIRSATASPRTACARTLTTGSRL